MLAFAEVIAFDQVEQLFHLVRLCLPVYVLKIDEPVASRMHIDVVAAIDAVKPEPDRARTCGSIREPQVL